MKAKYAALEKKCSELEAKLARYENLDSSNSSKPPSQDFKKNKNLPRIKGFRDSGGQPGHKGTTLQKVEHVDEVIVKWNNEVIFGDGKTPGLMEAGIFRFYCFGILI